MGESTDSTAAFKNALYQARSRIIEQVLQVHKVNIDDSLRSQTDMQYHYRKFLMRKTERNGLDGIQISGIPIDSSIIRASYVQLRRDQARGRNIYRHYLNLYWRQAWTDSLVQEFYDFDTDISEIIQTAAYYIDKPTDLAMIAFQIERLSSLLNTVADYRLQRAESLIADYQALYDHIVLKAVNVTPTKFNVMLLLGDRHLTGGSYDSSKANCTHVRLLRESDDGFSFAYDDTYCDASSAYPLEIIIILPNQGSKSVQLQLPGNRVIIKTLGQLILHYFEETQDGYAEMYMESITGQPYFIRGLHFNGLHLNMAMNGRGRTIKGSGQYQLRAPIENVDFQKLLRSKPALAHGGLVYTHPISGIEIDYCFENMEVVIKKH